MRAMRKLTVAVMLAITAPATTYALEDDSINSQAQQMNTLTKNAGQTNVANRIAADFITLTGSRDNATALVTALRNGTAITLTTTTTGGTATGTTTGSGTSTGTDATSTTFTPPTGKMGWGNVFISLALAQNALTQAGITQPTSADLQAALMGGTVTGADGKTVTLTGILQQRASGMGWGQIAQSYGVKLGPVVSSIKAANHRVAATSATTNKTASNTTTVTKSTTARADGDKSRNGIKVAASTTAGTSIGRGRTTAAGTISSSGSSRTGLTTATGTTAGSVGNRGLTTAAGTVGMGSAHGRGHGAGIVTASGSAAGAGATAAVHNANSSANVGAGIVSATGASVTSSGIISAQGGGQGQGHGHGKGKGPG